jgi:N-acetylglucosaminyldiphosphoundecaprenol N-acetyl-beta-D-mannosaminyltransferase
VEFVQVGAFGKVQLLNVDNTELLRILISNFISGSNRNKFIALHVSYFNNLKNTEYINSLQDAHLYADGMSVVIAANIRGLKQVRRSPTTDLAPKLISELTQIAGRKLKIGLIGGNNKFIQNVKEFFIDKFHVEVEYAINGYPDTWNKTQVTDIGREVDILFIGMGVPQESIFLESNKLLFRAKLILTCGGWFGFLVGGESRAPVLFQKMGLEWIWRLVQAPKRLLPRYLSGAANFLKFTISRN